MTFTAAALRGMIEDANERQKAYTVLYGKINQHTMSKQRRNIKVTKVTKRMPFTAAALRCLIEGANERQKAYKFVYGQ